MPIPVVEKRFANQDGVHTHFKQIGIPVTDQEGEALHVLTLSLVGEYKLFRGPSNQKDNKDPLQQWLQEVPQAWADTGGSGLAGHWPPILVQLKADATPTCIRQYPMPREVKQGITPHIKRLKDLGILNPCQSA